MSAAGPLIGIVWAVTLVGGRVWEWPVPAVARVLFGSLLLTVAMLLLVLTVRGAAYRACKLTTLGCAIVLTQLDAGLIIAAVLFAPTGWALAVAVTASLALTRAVPAILATSR